MKNRNGVHYDCTHYFGNGDGLCTVDASYNADRSTNANTSSNNLCYVKSCSTTTTMTNTTLTSTTTLTTTTSTSSGSNVTNSSSTNTTTTTPTSTSSTSVTTQTTTVTSMPTEVPSATLTIIELDQDDFRSAYSNSNGVTGRQADRLSCLLFLITICMGATRRDDVGA